MSCPTAQPQRERSWKVIFSAALMVLGMCSVLCAQVTPSEEKLVFADGLYSRGMYELAIEEYKGFLRDFPNDAKSDTAHFRLAESYRFLGKLKIAEQVYRHVFTTYPESEFRFKAGFRRAELFRGTSQYDGAVKLFGKVLKAKPPRDIASACQYYIGETYMEQGRTNEAMRAFETVKKDYSDSGFNPYALIRLGQIYNSRKGMEEKALLSFQEAISKSGKNEVAAEALFQTAEVYFQREDYKKSSELYGRLLAEFPHSPRTEEAALQAAWSSHNAGFFAAALKIASGEIQKLEKGPKESNVPEWLYLKANCQRQLMKSKEAIKTYSQLLDGDDAGDYLQASRYEKALTCYNIGDYEQAVEAANKVDLNQETSSLSKQQIYAMRKDVCWLLAESYGALMRGDEAIQYYRLIARDYPDSDVADDAAYRLAHSLQEKGSYKEASQYYNQVASNFPKSELAPRALFASAYCLARAKMDKEAIRDWSLLLKLYKEHSLCEEAYYQKALAEIRVDRGEDALVSLRLLLKSYSGTGYTADAHYWSGMLLKRADKLHDAQASLRLCLASGPLKEMERDAKYQLGIVLHAQDKSDEAAQIFHALLATPQKKVFPPALLEWLSEYLYEKKRYRESVDVAHAITDNDSSPMWKQISLCLAGRSIFSLGDTQDALKTFKEALSIDVKTHLAAESALRVGEIESRSGEHLLAVKYFKASAAYASTEEQLGIRARAYIGLGDIASEKEKPAEAARYYMSVAVLYDDPELVPECLYNASLAFRKIGKMAEADKAIAELKQRYPQSKWVKENI